MKILFITSSRIGDAVLSTGLLNHIEQKYPDAKVTIVCGPLAVSLFEGYPLLERVIGLRKEKRNGHWVRLWRMVVGTRWDMVVDLRDSAVSRLVWAGERYIFGKRIDKSVHKVLQNAAVMGLGGEPVPPRLWFSAEQKAAAARLVPDGEPVLGVGPSANWVGKTWPVERFIEVVDFLTRTGGYMSGARVAVFGAPGEEEDAYRLLDSLPDGRGLDLIAKGAPGLAAACLARCGFYIGNDSGLMHCAAAVGVRTLGVFGPSYPHIYAPYGAHAAYVSTPESFDELVGFDGYDPKTLEHSLMGTLSVDAVERKLSGMFSE